MLVYHEKNIRNMVSCVVTFGKFDGFHRGHRLLLEKTVDLAREYGVPSVVCTFDMKDWKGGTYDMSRKLCPTEEKCLLCEKYGIDVLWEYPFDDELASTAPITFLESFVRDKLHARAVVVGEDWHFGAGRGGDVLLLKASQKLYNFEAFVIPKETCQDREISSTWIREEVKRGNMENANILLGYPYSFAGKVKHGKALGRQLAYPTVNLIPAEDKLLPPYGVYDAKVTLRGKEYDAITNVGVRPTVSDEDRVTVESFILDFDEEIYDEDILVSLMHFERPEMRFDDVAELQKQLAKDLEAGRNYFGR